MFVIYVKIFPLVFKKLFIIYSIFNFHSWKFNQFTFENLEKVEIIHVPWKM